MNKHAALLIVILLTALPAWAAPVVTNVTGTVATGQTLTVTGSSLVNEYTNYWGWTSSQAGFESGTFFSTSANENEDGWISYDGSSMSPTTSVKLMGNKSAYILNTTTCPKPSSGCGGVYAWRYPPSPSATTRYVSAYVRYSGAWPDHYLKMFLVPNAGLYFQPNMEGTRDGNGDPQEWYIGHPEGGGESYKLYTETINVAQDVWHYWEFSFVAGGSSDAWVVWWDGEQVASGDIAHHVDANLYCDTMDYGIVNWSGTTGSLEMWMDRATTSTTRIYPACTIEVGNSPTYGAGSEKWQSPIYLSDGTVQFKADLAGLGDGPYYLWVTDNRQSRTATPYQLGSPVENAPVAAFSASVTSGTAPLEVTFTDASTNTPTSWWWSFGANQEPDSTTQNPTHTYTSPGTYSVTLIATNATGSDSEVKTDYITVTYPSSDVGSLLFSEDFEDGDTYIADWDPEDGSGYPTDSDAHGGSKSMKLTWDVGDTTPNIIGGGNSDAGTLRMNLSSAADAIYVSFWAKVSSNWTGSGLAYHPHLVEIISDTDLAIGGNWSNIAYNFTDAYIEVGGVTGRTPRLGLQDGKNIDEANIGTSLCATSESRAVNGCNGDCDSQGIGECYSAGEVHWNGRVWDAASALFDDTDWHHIEAYLKMNTVSGSVGQADGVLKLWLDDTLVIDENEVIIRTNENATMKFGQFIIGPYIGDGSPVTQSMWIDDLKVYSGLMANPTITFATPTSDATYDNGAVDKITIGGTATGDSLASVAWANDSGGSGTCTGTTSWSQADIQLYPGTNTITVTATDQQNNTSTDTLTVTYTPASGGSGPSIMYGGPLSGGVLK